MSFKRPLIPSLLPFARQLIHLQHVQLKALALSLTAGLVRWTVWSDFDRLVRRPTTLRFVGLDPQPLLPVKSPPRHRPQIPQPILWLNCNSALYFDYPRPNQYRARPTPMRSIRPPAGSAPMVRRISAWQKNWRCGSGASSLQERLASLTERDSDRP